MNTALREHVTGQAFVLTLHKTHIAALVAISNNDGRTALAMGRFVPAVRGLIDRGLVEHFPPVGEAGYARPFNEIYRLTRAGELCAELLVEAGLASQSGERAVA